MNFIERVGNAAVGCCVVIVGIFMLSGCDTVGGDIITLQKDINFRFEFSTEGLETGEEIVVNSVGQVDFDDLLTAEGFTKEEIVTVNIRSIEVERIAPAEATLSAFERIAFALVATGLTVPTIAESDELPAARETELNVLVPGITEVIWQPSFRGRLMVVPGSGDDEEYVLAATIDVVVQAEGV